MESLITLFVIIAVFNLINALVRAFKGSKAPIQGHDKGEPIVSVSVPPPLHEHEAEESRFFGTDDYDGLDSKNDKQEIAYQSEAEREKPAPADHLPAVGYATDNQGRTASVTSNLQQVLKDKDTLVAAFIFHEILSPPSALRKRR